MTTVGTQNTYFNQSTSWEVRLSVDKIMKRRMLVNIHYGNTKTGEAWLDSTSITGYIREGSLNGKPMVVSKFKTQGGFPILDNHIVKIDTPTGKIVYKHKDYHLQF